MTQDLVSDLAVVPSRARPTAANLYVLKRLLQKGKLGKVFVERLTEPLHLNFLSLFVWCAINMPFRSCMPPKPQ